MLRWRSVGVAVCVFSLVSGGVALAQQQDRSPADGRESELLEDVQSFVAEHGTRAKPASTPGSVAAGATRLLTPASSHESCLTEVHADPRFDTPFFDIEGYGASSDCDILVFAAITRDEWASGELALFAAFIDADLSLQTGCDGADVAVAAIWDRGLQAGAVSMPSCRSEDWSAMPHEAEAIRTSADNIGIGVELGVLGGQDTFGWWLGLSSIFDEVDFAPDRGFHRSTLESRQHRCLGSAATIVAQPGSRTVGTAGDDVIVGTPGPDVIAGRGGDDKICSLAGHDVVSGGGGADMIDAGRGSDEVSGGGGPDVIEGGTGDDTIAGDGGADHIRGQGGDDMVRGGTGNDRIIGGGGRDTLLGQRGRDNVSGGSGSDTLLGGSHDDVLRGGGGRDVLRGGTGPDVLSGGPKADELFGNGGNDILRGDRGPDELNGGSGTDRCDGGSGADTFDSCER